MRHILKNISEFEKRKILEQYNNSLIIETKKFNTLLNSKLGDVKPILTEENSFDCELNKKTLEDTKERIKNSLKPSVDWWINWLNDDITKTKFKKINKVNDKRLNDIYSNYFKALKEIQIRFVGPCTEYEFKPPKDTSYQKCGSDFDFYACFNKEEHPTRLNFNVSLLIDKDDDFIEQLYVHEIQHMFHPIQPINPDDVVWKTFYVGSNESKSMIDRIMKSFDLTQPDALKVKDELVFLIKMEKAQFNLVSISKNELSSTLFELRKRYKLKPGDLITKEIFKPYITELIETGNIEDQLFYDIMLAWGLENFREFDSFLVDLNNLALQDNKKYNNIV